MLERKNWDGILHQNQFAYHTSSWLGLPPKGLPNYYQIDYLPENSLALRRKGKNRSDGDKVKLEAHGIACCTYICYSELKTSNPSTPPYNDELIELKPTNRLLIVQYCLLSWQLPNGSNHYKFTSFIQLMPHANHQNLSFTLIKRLYYKTLIKNTRFNILAERSFCVKIWKCSHSNIMFP